MNDCVNVEVRDALPDLLHGRLSELDTATMNAHVESCADCRAELEIMRETMSSAAIAPRIDAAKIAAAIRPYASMNVPSKPASIFRKMPVVRVLAAAAFVAIGAWALTVGRDSTATRQTAATSPAATPANAAQSAIDNASAGTFAGKVAATTETQVASLSLVGNTGDLSDADLEQLVADLDGMEALPSAEPQSITITGEDPGSENDTID